MADDRPPSASAGVREAILTHAGSVIIGLSAGGYVVGYASVWLYASGLGISPRDLALSQSDYLLLAGLWALFLAVYALAATMAVFFEASLTLPFIAQAIPLSFMFAPLNPVAGMAVLTVLVIMGGGLVLWMQSRHARVRTPTRWLVAVHLGVLAGLVGAAGWLCWWWGDFVASNPDEAASRGPIALYFVLPPTEGLVSFADGDDACLLRVSDRVFVDDERVVVGSEHVVFRPTSCWS